MSATKHQCEECNGWGFLHQHHKPCKICGGTGYIIDIEDKNMSEPKPPYTVNPAVLPIAPEFMTAIRETSRLIQDALSTIAPLSGNDTITIDYSDWDTKCNTMAAIREKYREWQETDTEDSDASDDTLSEISDLLKKAGY